MPRSRFLAGAVCLAVGVVLSAVPTGVSARSSASLESAPDSIVHASAVVPQAVACDPNGGAYFAAGDGSPTDPYKIDDSVALANIDDSGGDFLGCSFQLTSDVTLAGSSWTPLGTFTGALDGAGFTIGDLVIDDSTSSSLGLFAEANGAAFIDLSLTGVNLSGKADVGGLVGFSLGNTTFTNISLSGRVSGEANVGGIVGNDRDGDFTSITATITVDDSEYAGNSYGLGGLIGYAEGSRVMGAQVAADVSGFSGLGGIAGYIGRYSGTRNPTIDSAEITGTIDAIDPTAGSPFSEMFAGVAGASEELEISNTTSSAAVTGPNDSSWAGGFIGQSDDTTVIRESSNSGTVTAGYEVGGLVGGVADNLTMGPLQILDSGNTADVTGEGASGGLVGSTEGDVEVTRSFSTGNVSSDLLQSGGMIAVHYSRQLTIDYSYATGNVVTVNGSGERAGGLVGEWLGDVTISNSYATGDVANPGSPGWSGGLVGSINT
jgi:hypothetical protein